ncbi:nuclear pore complex protein NUP153 [Acrasis kona]|uniref:Nuclear pore complex protein NUP153 n=1 Tax=Acrasis kona TaxID=1008807 RepID=A0AAW2YKH6_9EUKA
MKQFQNMSNEAGVTNEDEDATSYQKPSLPPMNTNEDMHTWRMNTHTLNRSPYYQAPYNSHAYNYNNSFGNTPQPLNASTCNNSDHIGNALVYNSTFTGAAVKNTYHSTISQQSQSQLITDETHQHDPFYARRMHFDSPQQHFCNVSIIGGKYDQTGNCWIDEGQKKIEIEVSTNIHINNVTVFCEKETTNNRTRITSATANKFELIDGKLRFRYRCTPSFPVKSGVTHSPLRFIAEVTENAAGNEEFYVYSKVPEQVRNKKKRDREEQDIDVDKDPPSVDSTSPPLNVQTLQVQNDRLTNIEKEVASLRVAPTYNEDLLVKVLSEVNGLAIKQDENHKTQMNALLTLQSSMEEMKELMKKT